MQSRQTEREIIAFYDGMRHMHSEFFQLFWKWCDEIDQAERTELELFYRQHGDPSIVGETLQGSGETD